VFLHLVVSAGHVVHFVVSRCERLTHYFASRALIRMGLVRITQKVRLDTLRQTFDFASRAICRSLLPSNASRVRNVNALFFFLDWVQCWSHKECTGTRYAEPVFLHPMGSVSHALHFVVSRVQNTDTLFFKLGWVRFRSHKKRVRTRYIELLFYASGGIYGSCIAI
jgi:hypothetical protein